jgi:hypothetical protein
MEETFMKAEELAGDIREYINVKLESVKLSLAEKISKMVAGVIAGFIVAAVGFLFIIFLGIALGFLLGSLLGSTWLGFLLVAGIYLLAAVIIWSAKTRIIQLPLMNSILSQLNQNEEEDEGY